jgi:tetratricopeptide (TPR) repeat protein
MRRCLWLCVLAASSSLLVAQQDSGKPTAPSNPPDSPAPSQSSQAPANSSDDKANSPKQPYVPNQPPPRSDRVEVQDLGNAQGESSSRDIPADVDAPPDDAKAHPQSSQAVANAEAASLGGSGVTEMHSWDPHKAAKDVEVGDFYFKRENYRAAEARYRDALLYKDDDAIATIKLAVCLEKLGILDDARAEYESYLRILPYGPKAHEAQKAIERLKTETGSK